MSDETRPPDDEDANVPETVTTDDVEPSPPNESIESEPAQFFQDGLGQVPSLHAAVERALQSVQPEDSDRADTPIAFPLPIELSLFQGAPIHLGSEPADFHEDEQEPTENNSNVISLMPAVAATGAVWDLNPAGAESIRDAFNENEELTPPEPHMLEGTVEALLFASDQPLSLKQLNVHLATPGEKMVRDALYRIQSRFRRPGSGIRLVEVAKGWQFRTDMRAARHVASMRGDQPVKLSKAALETLSIVAYRQPVTRAEVEELRGVDPGGILRMLSERGLTYVTGRKDEPGRPLLYGTTPEFLSLFGLRDLSDLPTLRDLRELQSDDGRDGIGGTEMEATLTEALLISEPPPATIGLVSIQEPLPLDGHEPID
jgi:segregation and condensation protein B